MPTGIFDVCHGRTLAPMVKLGGVHFRINPRVPMTVFGPIRSAFLACVALAFILSPVAGGRAPGGGEGGAGEAFGIAMHGAPALPAGFTHMPYAKSDAPKGGRLVWGLPGTF